MNQLNNGNAVNPPAVPMKLPNIKFKTGMLNQYLLIKIQLLTLKGQ